MNKIHKKNVISTNKPGPHQSPTRQNSAARKPRVALGPWICALGPVGQLGGISGYPHGKAGKKPELNRIGSISTQFMLRCSVYIFLFVHAYMFIYWYMYLYVSHWNTTTLFAVRIGKCCPNYFDGKFLEVKQQQFYTGPEAYERCAGWLGWAQAWYLEAAGGTQLRNAGRCGIYAADLIQWDFQGPPIMGPLYGKFPILFPCL